MPRLLFPTLALLPLLLLPRQASAGKWIAYISEVNGGELSLSFAMDALAVWTWLLALLGL